MATIAERRNITDVVLPVTEAESSVLIDDKVLMVFQLVIFSLICQTIVVFGVGTNIINIVCFVKQGFKDPVNVSFLGLAISDLGCLVTLIFTNICFTPSFSALDLPIEPIEFQYLTSGIPHLTFTRITAWITAFITIERCLCITAPLKVKTTVTSKRVAVIIVITFIVLIFSVAPIYVVSSLGMRFFPDRNKTLMGLIFTENRESVERICLVINNAAVPFAAFLVIIICTTTLVVKLKEKSEWRKKSTTNGQGDNVSTRNQKVAKMVVMISVLFIVCFVLVSLMFVAMAVDSELTVVGKHRSAGVVLAGIGLVLESINSSSNIFIYYYMSTKYSKTLHNLFCNAKVGW